jgi:hypothetical protein
MAHRGPGGQGAVWKKDAAASRSVARRSSTSTRASAAAAPRPCGVFSGENYETGSSRRSDTVLLHGHSADELFCGEDWTPGGAPCSVDRGELPGVPVLEDVATGSGIPLPLGLRGGRPRRPGVAARILDVRVARRGKG